MCLTTLGHDDPSGGQQDATIISQPDSLLLALPTELLIDIFLELQSSQIFAVQMVGTPIARTKHT